MFLSQSKEPLKKNAVTSMNTHYFAIQHSTSDKGALLQLFNRRGPLRPNTIDWGYFVWQCQKNAIRNNSPPRKFRFIQFGCLCCRSEHYRPIYFVISLSPKPKRPPPLTSAALKSRLAVLNTEKPPLCSLQQQQNSLKKSSVDSKNKQTSWKACPRRHGRVVGAKRKGLSSIPDYFTFLLGHKEEGKKESWASTQTKKCS